MMDEIDLTKYSTDNPLILEKPLTTEEQVIAFNENMFGNVDQMYEDFKYTIEISDDQLKLVEQEKGQWWGTIESISRYSMENCINLGYIPWKLTYLGFDQTHKFYLSCEDRRITNRETGLGQP